MKDGGTKVVRGKWQFIAHATSGRGRVFCGGEGGREKAAISETGAISCHTREGGRASDATKAAAAGKYVEYSRRKREGEESRGDRIFLLFLSRIQFPFCSVLGLDATDSEICFATTSSETLSTSWNKMYR